MKNRLTFEEHKEVASRVKDIRHLLFGLLDKTNAGMRKEHQMNLSRAIDHLDKYRSDLEDVMFRDHPHEANIGIYYGNEVRQ